MANVAIEAEPAPATGELSGRALEMAVCVALGWRYSRATKDGPAYLHFVPTEKISQWQAQGYEVESSETPRWGNPDYLQMDVPHYLTDPAAAMDLLVYARRRWATDIHCGIALDFYRLSATCQIWHSTPEKPLAVDVVKEGESGEDWPVVLCRAVLAACNAEVAR